MPGAADVTVQDVIDAAKQTDVRPGKGERAECRLLFLEGNRDHLQFRFRIAFDETRMRAPHARVCAGFAVLNRARGLGVSFANQYAISRNAEFDGGAVLELIVDHSEDTVAVVGDRPVSGETKRI